MKEQKFINRALRNKIESNRIIFGYDIGSKDKSIEVGILDGNVIYCREVMPIPNKLFGAYMIGDECV